MIVLGNNSRCLGAFRTCLCQKVLFQELTVVCLIVIYYFSYDVSHYATFLEALVQVTFQLKSSCETSTIQKIASKIEKIANDELHTGLMLSVSSLRSLLDADDTKLGDFTETPEFPHRRSTLAVKARDINYSQTEETNEDEVIFEKIISDF